jgi:hypothetical protein
MAIYTDPSFDSLRGESEFNELLAALWKRR